MTRTRLTLEQGLTWSVANYTLKLLKLLDDGSETISVYIGVGITAGILLPTESSGFFVASRVVATLLMRAVQTTT